MSTGPATPAHRRSLRLSPLALALALAVGALVMAAPALGSSDLTYIPPLGASKPAAPVILHVFQDSPAEHAGLAAGDTLWRVDGWPIQTHEDLTDILLQRRERGPARFTVGKRGGRRIVHILPHGVPPRIGVSLVSVQRDTQSIQIHDVGQSVQGSVSEWASITVIQIRTYNHGTRPLTVGPQSVAIVDGRGATVPPLPAEEAIARVYGAPAMGADDRSPGADATLVESEIDHRNRVDGIRSMRAAAMKSTIIPPGSDVEGMLFVGSTGLARPITVLVTLSGRPYTMRFGLAHRLIASPDR